ncbi:TrbI/VirB10 family protein [Acidithiobacillus ferrivorans]|uniref:TrbI/VirB10 family protein n=1 Tax=Acidithiobacillus ferrivorans TaxID=160808 RepID=A0A7T4WCN6_9PROT|nr:TrbI/VirB10 family protein [Acidithiobacillus ferrivorans]QQD71960.1 TrbI/VirB10 family protein [Acidithiobacillus ferrivorans]
MNWKFWERNPYNGTNSHVDEDQQTPGFMKGDIKPDGGMMAAFINKKPLWIALVAAGALYFAFNEYRSYEASHKTTERVVKKIGPVSSHPEYAAAPPPVAPTSSAVSAAMAHSKSGSSSPSAPGPGQGAPGGHAPPPQPQSVSPQVQALQASLAGGQSSGMVPWPTTRGSAKAGIPPATGEPFPVKLAVPAPKSHAESGVGVYDQHLVRKEASPYELLQGSVIPAILSTGIDSDIPGEVTAVVAHPVYDSNSGAYLLIPAGSKLVGIYASKVIAGQTRVAMGWERVIFPNGTYVNLGAMPGAGPHGFSGFHDEVDDHTWAIFKNALLMSLINVGMAMASPTSTATNTTGVTGNQALSDSQQALSQTFGQAEAGILQKGMNVSPTLKIRLGYAFEVVVTKDLVFPGTYNPAPQEASATPSAPALAAMINPYR